MHLPLEESLLEKKKKKSPSIWTQFFGNKNSYHQEIKKYWSKALTDPAFCRQELVKVSGKKYRATVITFVFKIGSNF